MMIMGCHLLRPWWLLCVLPLCGLLWFLWREKGQMSTLNAICDRHLLAHLVQDTGVSRRRHALVSLFLSALFIVISATGPGWSKWPVAVWKSVEPRIIVLDLSENMQVRDVSPDRLSRAKFKLLDLFKQAGNGQFGLIAFTGEPFVLSPLTEDSNTIVSLLQALNPEIMPVGGQRLDTALQEASQLLKQAGFAEGQILVMTASPPDAPTLEMARALAAEGIMTSVMPIMANQTLLRLFKPLAQAGKGVLLPFSEKTDDWQQWIKTTANNHQLVRSKNDNLPRWHDEGRWFLLPALLFLLPVFQRGWLQRIES